MRKQFLHSIPAALVVLLLLCFSEAAWAEKIGVVNIEEVLVTSDVGKAANDDLKKAFDKNKKAIQDLEKSLQKDKEEMDRQGPILTEKARKDKESAYQKKYRDYQDLVKDANEEMQSRRQELYSKNYPEILKIVGAIGEKEHYTVIFDVATTPLAYVSKDNNLTQRVIDEFNKQYRAKKK